MIEHDKLVIVTEETEGDFTRLMIKNNEIHSLMPVKTRGIDGKLVYEFATDGYEAFTDYCVHDLGRESIEGLIKDLLAAVKEGQDYLLVPQDYVVETDKIFVKERHFYFTYVSGYEISLDEQLAHLMEFLMGKISHRDRELVIFVYGLYNICKENHGNFNELEEYVNGDTQSRMEKSGLLEEELSYTIDTTKEPSRFKLPFNGVYVVAAAIIAVIGIIVFI